MDHSLHDLEELVVILVIEMEKPPLQEEREMKLNYHGLQHVCIDTPIVLFPNLPLKRNCLSLYVHAVISMSYVIH